MAGFSGQLGFAAESSYGTGVTVTKFAEVDNANLKKVPNWAMSNGVRAGQMMRRSEDKSISTFDVSGGWAADLTPKNVALLFKHALGSVSTSGAGPYTHTITPGSKTGLSLTVQTGIPRATSSTVDPFTAVGVKIIGFEVSWQRDQFVTVRWDAVAKDITTGTALATASYTASNPPYGWPHVAVTIGGSAFNCLSGSIKYGQGLKTRFFGGATTTAEPLQNEFIDATCELTGEWDSTTHYDRVIAGTEAAVSVAMTNGSNSITFAGNATFRDGQPELSGLDLLEQPLVADFTATAADSTGFSVVVVSSESTP